MSLIWMIFQILLALPDIFKLIHEIMAIIEELKGSEKTSAQTQLKGILKKHLKAKDRKAAHDELAAFKDDLKGKYGLT